MAMIRRPLLDMQLRSVTVATRTLARIVSRLYASLNDDRKQPPLSELLFS